MPEIKSRSFTCSLVVQGGTRFFTLSVPSKVLSETCFITSREEDAEAGFQRLLNKKRAKDIAAYIDGGGVIPSSIILSAQEDAQFEYDSKKRTVSFLSVPTAFKVIDGQHRLWGFRLAEQDLRVPVVVFSGLSVSEEARLFIDVNTKQKPVPQQLVLDIRKLASYKQDQDTQINEIFDLFHDEVDSALSGMTSKSKKASGKIDRVTFTTAFKQVLPAFQEVDISKIYSTLNQYLYAVKLILRKIDPNMTLSQPMVFRSFSNSFKEVASLLMLQNKALTTENFVKALAPVANLTATNFRKPHTINSISTRIVEVCKPQVKI